MKKVLWISSGAMATLLIAGLVLAGAKAVSAQDPEPPSTPEADVPPEWPGRGPHGMGGPCEFFGGPANRWEVFDAAAEALGLTPEALFSELHAGKTLAEIAEARGVDLQAIQEAMDAARAEAMRQAIEQAVADGRMTQEQANWMLEGIEKGYTPIHGPGFAPPRGFPGHAGPRWQGGRQSNDE